MGHAHKFSTRALTRSRGWDAWLPWQELPLPIPQRWHPRALHCLRAYQLPKTGECPSRLLPHNAHVAGWCPGPLPWVPVPNALPTRPMAPRAPASCGRTRAPYAIPAPHGPLAYRGQLARCPGYPLSDTHRSQPRSQPVNRAPAPLQTGFEPTFPPTTKRPLFCQFD